MGLARTFGVFGVAFITSSWILEVSERYCSISCLPPNQLVSWYLLALARELAQISDTMLLNPASASSAPPNSSPLCPNLHI